MEPTSIAKRRSDTLAHESFEQFYRHHFVTSARLATLLLGSTSAGSDIAQEAMVVTHRAWATLEMPQAYLRSVTVNLCRNVRRRRFRERRWLQRQRWVEEQPLELQDDIRPALRKLSKQQREVVVLRFFEDLTVPDIARLLGIAEGTVKSTLHRALQILRKELT